MPWTFAHPAAVLPIRWFGRRGLSTAALVLGSVSPDFGYYLGLFDLATCAHTWWGVFVVCVPSVWLADAAWRRAWRPLALLLPARHREAWLARPPAHVTARVFIASAALGAVTHGLWDAFTHRGGWFVQHLAVLREPLVFGVPGYTWLQHGSTLIGVVALAVVYRRALPAVSEPADAQRYRDLAVLAAVALVAAWVSAGAPWRAHFHFLIVATDALVLGALALAALRQRG